jgi:hypothetical protein
MELLQSERTSVTDTLATAALEVCSGKDQPFFRTCSAQQQTANKRNTGRKGTRQSQRQEYLRSASGSGVTEVICGSNEKGRAFVRGLKE